MKHLIAGKKLIPLFDKDALLLALTTAAQSRREVCFFSVKELEESKAVKSERRKSMAVNLKSRKNVSRIESQLGDGEYYGGSEKNFQEQCLIQPRER